MTQGTALVLGAIYFLWCWRRYVLRKRGRYADYGRQDTRRKLRTAAIIGHFQGRRSGRR